MTRNLHEHELLRKKIHKRIIKLEVHLHIALERNPKREHYRAGLTLRLPSNILHSAKSGPDLLKAFDQAVKALLREL